MFRHLAVCIVIVVAMVLLLGGALTAERPQMDGTRAIAHSKSTLAGPVTWGSPDQPYGKRRAVTAEDRAQIASYRSGKTKPIFSTDFSDPAELRADWEAVSDDVTWGDFQSCRRPGNVEATSGGLRLKTLVATDCHHKWSTGYIHSKATYTYGFFEATMKIADITGMNNAFWMTTEDHAATGDHFEIDVSEAQYPSYDHLGLQQYPAKGNKKIKHTGMGWGVKFVEDMSADFHDYGILWTPTEIIYEIDGQPVAAVLNGNAVHPPSDIAFSTALLYKGIPEHPEGHDTVVRSVRVFAYDR